ncbi:MAG: hypothetical protein PWQ82_1119 [Thermosediminibacterales bacterium]|nr:hypothetical protein [Thermosediminibacterales bacterium]MDK2835687.1 hypothetical protein [Thermosediminibacterales bacterium]
MYLCKDCHEDVHAGRVYIPIKGVRQWRALGTMNAIMGKLREMPFLKFVPASDATQPRKAIGLEKTHANDALATAMVLYNCTGIEPVYEIELTLVKFRRHNRARIHAVKDRLYKVEGKIIAKIGERGQTRKNHLFLLIYLHCFQKFKRNLRCIPAQKSLIR